LANNFIFGLRKAYLLQKRSPKRVGARKPILKPPGDRPGENRKKTPKREYEKREGNRGIGKVLKRNGGKNKILGGKNDQTMVKV